MFRPPILRSCDRFRAGAPIHGAPFSGEPVRPPSFGKAPPRGALNTRDVAVTPAIPSELR